jgi:hypothetical protein
LAESFRNCPICDTNNHPNAVLCMTCGANIADVTPQTRASVGKTTQASYDFRYGETDLQESTLRSQGQMYLVFGATIIIVAILVFVGVQLLVGGTDPSGEQPASMVTPSARPTLAIATVTQGPPTSTATWTPPPTATTTNTPTPSPCVQIILEGDSLIGAITRCGYTSLDIMPTVMALNNLSDAASIRSGQEIIMPYPSPTVNPNSTPTPTMTPNTQSNDDVGTEDDEFALVAIDPFAPTATATLPAGVVWHTVQREENIITIAVQYDANAKVLSELNPEVDFARCEFGERFGGPECLVQLFEGQQLRVPAPTPTPTLSPTPDPNATATPTATPTFNEPNAISPSDAAFFRNDELVTLRWVPTGTLGVGEVYKITIHDVTSDIVYTATTRDIAFIVPVDWQGSTFERHNYRWTVGIIDEAQPDNIRFETDPLTFVWQGLVESNAS